MTFVYRPFPHAPQAAVSGQPRRDRRYKSSFATTRAMLKFELAKLRASGALIVLGFPPSCFTADGRVRVDDTPMFPDVIVAFESEHGWLKYACGRNRSWKANLYAIALTLRKTREMIDHGAINGKRAYIPWRIEKPVEAEPRSSESPGPGPQPFSDVRQAAYFIGTHAKIDGTYVLNNAEQARRAYRLAAAKLHPDRAGDDGLFIRLQSAWGLIKQRHGL